MIETEGGVLAYLSGMVTDGLGGNFLWCWTALAAGDSLPEGVALDIHSHHVCRPDHGKIPRLQPPHIPLHLAQWLRPDRAGCCWPALSSTAVHRSGRPESIRYTG